VLAERGTSSAAAAHAVWIRHAGLVAGILLLTPLLTTDLAAAGKSAELRGIAVVLDAPVSIGTKARLTLDLAPVLTRPASKELPDFTSAVAPQHDPALTRMGQELDRVVEATITRGFRRSYLLAALLGLLALVPLALLPGAGARRRSASAAAVAVAVAVALVGAELAGGAEAFGARPRLLPPCAPRPAVQATGADAELQRLAVTGLDFVACRLHTTREGLILDAGSWVARARTDVSRWAAELGIPLG
jgi:hypothetical protein